MSRDTPLKGLEVDNLLGFLTLLGLLRALEEASPDWQPRAYFSGVPLEARLALSNAPSPTEIASVAAAGASKLAPHFRFDAFQDLNFDTAAARGLLARSREDERSASMLSALFSDAAIRPKEDKIEATVLCAMFGQGHQHFLDRIVTVSQGTPARSASKKKLEDLNDPRYIERALFSPWLRKDKTDSFRWDFAEDRRYAMRAVDPSKDQPTTEHGANRLAVLGLLSFQSAPVVQERRGAVVLATRGVSRGSNRQPRITWPIWTTPASLAAIEALLDEPEFSRDEPDLARFNEIGIHQARRVVRLTAGKFFNFSRAMTLR